MELLRGINNFFVEKEKNRLAEIPVRYLPNRETREISQLEYYDKNRTFFLKTSAGCTIIGGAIFLGTGIPLMLFAVPNIFQGVILETWRAHTVVRIQAIQELYKKRNI